MFYNKEIIVNNSYEKFKKVIFDFKNKNPLIKKIIVGYSTGPDSTFLLIMLKKYIEEYKDIDLIVAHVFHDWKNLGEEILNEQRERLDFCINFCKSFNLPLEIFHGNSDLFLNKGSIEAVGRKMRRFYFFNLLKKYENSVIALGHTEDENLETFFIKLIRGASLSGLTGIKNFDKNFFRPLLNFKKSEILDFLKEEKIEYCFDKTNESDLFLRARIRKYLIPALELTDLRAKKNINKTITNLLEADKFIKSEVENFFIDEYMGEFIFNRKCFIEKLPFLQREIILKIFYKKSFPENKISKSILDEVIRFIKNKESVFHTIKNITIHKRDRKVYFY